MDFKSKATTKNQEMSDKNAAKWDSKQFPKGHQILIAFQIKNSWQIAGQNKWKITAKSKTALYSNLVQYSCTIQMISKYKILI